MASAPPPGRITAFAEKTPYSALEVLTRQAKRPNLAKSRPRLHPNSLPAPIFRKCGNQSLNR
jgi:hypothetical protein